MVGRTTPGAQVSLGEERTVASSVGAFVIGFDRDAGAEATVRIAGDGTSLEQRIAVTPRTYRTQEITDPTRRSASDELFPRDWFDPTGEATTGDTAALASVVRTRAVSENVTSVAEGVRLKEAAFASRDTTVAGFADRWQPPVRGFRITSEWGASRTVNTPQGRLQRAHYGIDIATPLGTPIVAPAAAKVVLAQPELYYEGGCVFLDHGQGLISVYLHMMSLDVEVNDIVEAGQRIGTTGATGRVTGPHLCWRMKWRRANLDPTLMLPGGVADLT